ncbi:hypothetical protein [Micromonospora sp. S-DT3-3-22]|uniref:hypothetical protein n=1 Tax=Micromonospora sp. S-DT3-3-22 TaxID=2755359 RepID=UPI00188EF872|nr:hypothetical protein [Micromonospora sp. S-DT3-3-22]
MRLALVVTGVLLAVIVAYAGSCIVRPFRDCWCCKGRAHHRSKRNPALSRPCRWCRSSGKRLRLGRRAWNRARRTARAAA